MEIKSDVKKVVFGKSLNSEINCDFDGTIRKLSLNPKLSHRDSANLILTLTSPDNTSYTFLTSERTYINSTLVGQLDKEIYISRDNKFYGKACKGIWKLKIESRNYDTTKVEGALYGWSLDFQLHEEYDTSDPAIKKMLLDELCKLKLPGGVKTDGGTKENPTVIKAGFVFCDFSDKPGGSVDALNNAYNKLIGPNNKLAKFIEDESKGLAKLEVEVYGTMLNGIPTRSWVRLPHPINDYKDKLITTEKSDGFENNYIEYKSDNIKPDLDELIEFPDDWQVVFLAFPDTPSAQYSFTNSHCNNCNKVDNNQDINIIFMDPAVYQEAQPERTTIHELGHALGLVDLYNGSLNRSYGWSLMSDCHSGWHLLGLEKLLLGWDSVDNYLFLKQGKCNIEIKAQSETQGKKGVIILPNDNASKVNWYFLEMSQETGKSEANKTAFNNYGLLLMVAKASISQGFISPFVASRNEGSDYGGGSSAPFTSGNFATNGINCNNILYDPTKKSITCTIELDADYEPGDSADILRENEFIVSGSYKFMLTMEGELKFNDDPCIDGGKVAISIENDLKSKGYGFCAYVDNNGVFKLDAGTAKALSTNVKIQSFGAPSGVPLTTGEYFFKISVKNGKPGIDVYQGRKGDANPTFKYRLFNDVAKSPI